MLNFCYWLEKQINRDDPVGDLARDAQRDSDAPKHSNAFTIWQDYLNSRFACDGAMDALKEAFAEYRKTIR